MTTAGLAAALALVALTPLPGARSAVTVQANAPSTTRCGASTVSQCAESAVSADGRRVVFSSEATNLVAGEGDTNAHSDVFLADIAGHDVTIRRVSIPDATSGGTGGQADDESDGATISPNGEWVAFESRATNLVGGDNDGVKDVYVYQVSTGRLFLASTPDASTGAPAANRFSLAPSVANDGSVAFASFADNLVSTPSPPRWRAVFVRRDPAGAAPTTVLVHLGDGGAAADGPASEPSIDAGGTKVAFTTAAANVAGLEALSDDDIVVHDLGTGTTTRLTTGADASGAAMSPDGDEVTFRATNSISADDGDDLDDIYRSSSSGGAPTLISTCPACGSTGDRPAVAPSISSGGAVVFASAADFNGPASDSQVWLRTGTIGLVSRTPAGAPGDGAAEFPSISADGNFVVFASDASNLVTGDTNGETDVFLVDVRPGGRVVRLTGPTPLTPTETPPTLPPTTTPTAPPAGDEPPPSLPGLRRSGYWMLDAEGIVYSFGEAKRFGDPSAALGNTYAADLEPTPSGNGYWIVDRRGRVFGFGDANSNLLSADRKSFGPEEKVTSMSATPTGAGYWIFTTSGRVLAHGDARFHGDMSAVKLNGPVLDSIPTPSGNGYYMVASDGGIFAFGDAAFHGSMGGKTLNAPVQSLVPDGDNDGYWLVASDGGIFAFGAPFKGSMGDKTLNKPVTGMVRFGDGYLMVGEDGGIFNFSNLPFLGSLGDKPPKDPIVSVAVL